ncbi:MAG: hypothetical protein ACRD88_02960, partial [Terriglobia bacterium]
MSLNNLADQLAAAGRQGQAEAIFEDAARDLPPGPTRSCSPPARPDQRDSATSLRPVTSSCGPRGSRMLPGAMLACSAPLAERSAPSPHSSPGVPADPISS